MKKTKQVVGFGFEVTKVIIALIKLGTGSIYAEVAAIAVPYVFKLLQKKLKIFNELPSKELETQMNDAIQSTINQTMSLLENSDQRELFTKVSEHIIHAETKKDKSRKISNTSLSFKKLKSIFKESLNDKSFRDGDKISPQDIQDINNLFLETLRENIQKYSELDKRTNWERFNNLEERMDNVEEKVEDLDIRITEHDRQFADLTTSSTQAPDKLLTQVPSPKTTEFVGRKDEIDKITELIKTYQKPVLLHGMGGMGKSELAIKLFREWEKKGVPGSEEIVHFGWINYSGDIKRDLASSLYRTRKIKKTEDGYNAAVEYINKLEEKLILFIDNFNDPPDEDIKILTGLICCVIVTSRTKLPQFELVDIKKLSKTECFQIYLFHLLEGKVDEENLRKNISEADEKIIKEIIKRAGYNTFVVERLALTQKNSGKTPKAFHAKLLKEGFNLEGIEAVDMDGYNAVVIEHMAKLFSITHLNAAQKHILQLFSILPCRPLPGDRIQEWFGEKNNDNANALVKSGWLIEIKNEESRGKRYQMNQIIAETLRYSTKTKYRDIEPMIRTIAGDLEGAETATFSEIVSLIEFAKSAANYCTNELQEETPILAKLEHQLGMILSEQGDYRTALEWSKKAAFIRERELGSGHIDTARTYNTIAHLYYLLGDYSTAIGWYEKIRRVIEYAPWRNDNSILVLFYDGFATCFYALGEYHAALDYFEEVLRIQTRLYGHEDIRTSTTYNNIALVYDSLGDYTKSLVLFEKALAIDERFLGKDHPHIAGTYNNIAGLYLHMGDYTKSLAWFEKALAIYERFLGKDHPHTAKTYNNIALVYDSVGEYQNALEWYEKTLAIDERVLGREHPNTAKTYNNIAHVYDSVGEYQNALKWYEKALAIYERVLGQEHPDTARTYNNIALVYDSMGEYPKSLALFEKALAIYEWVLGQEHPSTAVIYNNIASVYSHIGEYSKVLEWYEKALKISEQILGNDHPDTAVIYNNIALAYTRMADYSKAFEWYEKVLVIVERVLGKEHHNTGAIYNNIALVYDSMGDYSKALEWYEKALVIQERVFGKDHPNTATMYNNIANLHYSKGEYDKSLVLFRQAYKVLLSSLGANHPTIQKYYNNMIDAYHKSGRNEAEFEVWLTGSDN